MKYLLFFVFSYVLSSIPIKDCVVDTNGDYKYIQILITNRTNSLDSKIIVRGGSEWRYHPAIYRDFLSKLRKNDYEMYNNYNFQPIGGGFIRVSPYHVELYGSSGTYGKCNHVLSASILKDCIPDNYKIEYNPNM